MVWVVMCGVFLIILVYGSTYIKKDIFGSNNDRLDYLYACIRSLENKGCPRVITAEEFEEKTSLDYLDREEWSVCFGHVINLKGFSEKHPGGNFLSHFVGRDMTPWMLITHAKSQSALKLMAIKCVGIYQSGNKNNDDLFDMSLLPPMDVEYIKLFFSFNNRKLFATPNAWTIRDLVEVYLPIIVGYYLVLGYPSLYWLGIILMCFTGGRQGIFYHDIMHRSVFTCAKKARNFVYYTSMVIWAFDFNVVGDIHDVHHGFVNIIGLDTAVEMPLLPVDPIHTANGRLSFPKKLREGLFAPNIYFYALLANFLYPFYVISPFLTHYFNTRDSFLKYGAIAILRILAVFYFWEYQKQFVIAASVGFFYFAFVATMNHFHKKMTTVEKFFSPKNNRAEHSFNTFVELQSQTVQNTDHGPLVDAILGHFYSVLWLLL